MQFTQEGKFMYEDEYELTYNLLNALSMSVRPDGSIIDTEISGAGTNTARIIGTPITFSGKILKANIDRNNIHYAGEGEVMLDVLTNNKMLDRLLGLFLDKLRVFDSKEVLSYFSNEIKDDNDVKTFNVNVKFENGEEYNSAYYLNKCLPIIDLIFQMSEENVDLSNFNIPVVKE